MLFTVFLLEESNDDFSVKTQPLSASASYSMIIIQGIWSKGLIVCRGQVPLLLEAMKDQLYQERLPVDQKVLAVTFAAPCLKVEALLLPLMHSLIHSPDKSIVTTFRLL